MAFRYFDREDRLDPFAFSLCWHQMYEAQHLVSCVIVKIESRPQSLVSSKPRVWQLALWHRQSQEQHFKNNKRRSRAFSQVGIWNSHNNTRTKRALKNWTKDDRPFLIEFFLVRSATGASRLQRSGRERASIPRSRVAAGPESAGVLGVGEGEVDEGGARLSCVGRSSPLAAPGSDTRFIASICSLFSPILLFAWLPSWGEQCY